ncbi:MAG: hypothetical protein LBB29_03205 [Holosporaceae bacterium]|jgi:hypothetical protein|nr:hypothetical protein [Holosporaceae bacterium]
MIRINKKRTSVNHDNKDIKIARDSIKADQFLEIATAKSVYLESIECGGIKILAKKIFFENEIIFHGPVVLAAMEIHIN